MGSEGGHDVIQPVDSQQAQDGTDVDLGSDAIDAPAHDVNMDDVPRSGG
ncbi:MAG: hypothetical protein WCJ30_21230 [Deltaproteobacteria bacterium]